MTDVMELFATPAVSRDQRLGELIDKIVHDVATPQDQEEYDLLTAQKVRNMVPPALKRLEDLQQRRLER